jgi:hypothetical protein
MLMKELESLMVATGFMKEENPAHGSAGKYRGDFKKDLERN